MDATLVTAWKAICQLFSPAFTAPTLVTFVHIATGWVLGRSQPRVTNLVGTIGDSLLGHAAKHWTVYERFFYRTVWSLDALSRLLLTAVVAPLIRAEATEKVIDLNIDDTTCGRCGKHVACAGYFKDASVGNTLKTVVHWSHNWVIGCVSMRAQRWSNWVMGLPVWFTLYRKRPDCDRQHPFRTRQQIAAAMIRETRNALPDWTIRVAADGQYATGTVVQAAAETGTNLVSRIRSDAALYDLPPKRKRFKRGRRAKRGKRLPKPKQLARRQTGWRTVEITIYGKRVKRHVLSIVCLWYHVSKDRPVKVLVVRDPSGKQADDYMVCTDPTVSDAEIIERFAARWSIEEAIQHGKQIGGMEKVQGWCRRTVVRQAPLAMFLITLVTAWYVQYGVRARWAQPHGSDWTPNKAHPSYLDMVATLRKVLWTDRIKCNSTRSGRVRELWKRLQFTLCAAA